MPSTDPSRHHFVFCKRDALNEVVAPAWPADFRKAAYHYKRVAVQALKRPGGADPS